MSTIATDRGKSAHFALGTASENDSAKSFVALIQIRPMLSSQLIAKRESAKNTTETVVACVCSPEVAYLPYSTIPGRVVTSTRSHD
jgi:hypothetical protein